MSVLDSANKENQAHPSLSLKAELGTLRLGSLVDLDALRVEGREVERFDIGRVLRGPRG